MGLVSFGKKKSMKKKVCSCALEMGRLLSGIGNAFQNRQRLRVRTRSCTHQRKRLFLFFFLIIHSLSEEKISDVLIIDSGFLQAQEIALYDQVLDNRRHPSGYQYRSLNRRRRHRKKDPETGGVSENTLALTNKQSYQKWLVASSFRGTQKPFGEDTYQLVELWREDGYPLTGSPSEWVTSSE